MRGTFVFLIVVAGLLVAADRVGAWEAGNLIASRLARTYALTPQPTVTVRGVPFLTQWAQGHYREIDLQIPDASLQGVTVSDIRARVQDVSTPPFATSGTQLGDATAGSVSATGLVPFDGLGLPPGLTAAADGGRLRLTGTVSLGGIPVPVTALVTVRAVNGQLVLTPQSVVAAGRPLPATLSPLIERQLMSTISIGDLPDGLRLDSAAVTPTGLRLTASGRNLRVPS